MNLGMDKNVEGEQQIPDSEQIPNSEKKISEGVLSVVLL